MSIARLMARITELPPELVESIMWHLSLSQSRALADGLGWSDVDFSHVAKTLAARIVVRYGLALQARCLAKHFPKSLPIIRSDMNDQSYGTHTELLCYSDTVLQLHVYGTNIRKLWLTWVWETRVVAPVQHYRVEGGPRWHVYTLDDARTDAPGVPVQPCATRCTLWCNPEGRMQNVMQVGYNIRDRAKRVRFIEHDEFWYPDRCTKLAAPSWCTPYAPGTRDSLVSGTLYT
jgi:hypothetical protein